MGNTHITAEGQKIFISQMDTNHLLNTIKLILKHIKDANEMVSGISIKWNMDLYIAGIDEETVKRNAKHIMMQAHEKLWKYIIEAVIRGENLTTEFREVFGRKWKSTDVSLMTATTSKFLSEGFSLDDDYWKSDIDW